MNIIIINRPIKKRKLLLAFFVVFNMFISDNVFAIAHWRNNFVECNWKSPKKKSIIISAAVYDYSFGPKSEHAYLEHCKFEASVDGENYYQLMDIRTLRQNISMFTTIYFANKLNRAKIQFSNNYDNTVINWPDAPNSILEVEIRNKKKIAIVSLVWCMDRIYKDVGYIRVSGKWAVDPPYPGDEIKDVVYKIELPDKSMLESNTKNNTFKVFNDSEAIVIKGADLVANIKVYTTSGVEINNSVISNNDVVKINLPAKQIYIVHIGKSRYKVAL